MEDDEEIKKYFAAFHLHDKIPTAVVVDDFGDLFDDRFFLFFFGGGGITFANYSSNVDQYTIISYFIILVN